MLILKAALNRYLRRNPRLRGHVGRVSWNPLTGRFTAAKVSLVAFKNGATMGSVQAKTAVLRLSIRQLARGRIVADLDVDQPAILWRRSTPASRQAVAGPPEKARDGRVISRAVRSLPAMRIERIRIRNGEFHAQNVPGQNGVDLRLEDIDAQVDNFATRDALATPAPTTASLSARAMRSGRLWISATGVPLAKRPFFDASLRLESLDLPEVGSVIRHAIGADVRTGNFSLFAEASAAGGAVRGYVKPVIDRLALDRPPSGSAWRTRIGKVATMLVSNDRAGRIAAKFPFSGAFERPEVRTSAAMRSLVRNAFGKPATHALDGGIAASQVAGEVQRGELLGPPAPEARWKRPFRLIAQTFSAWSADGGPRMGAALSYYAVFSLAPLILLGVAIAGLFFGDAAVEGRIISELRGIMGASTAATIQSMVEAARRPAAGIAATVVGLFTLGLGASAVMIEVKGSLNRIWRAEPPRGVLGAIRKRVLALSAVLTIGFLLLVSLLASAGISAAAGLVNSRFPVPAVALQAINLGASIAIITVLFAILYRLLPDAEIEWKDVWVGSAVTTALFVLGKQALGIYLGRAVTASAYGAAGSVLILLVWVYYSAQIFYLGAEFTRVYSETWGSRAPRDAFGQYSLR